MGFWPILSVVFALAAAFLWGWSALINVPVLKSGYGTLVSAALCTFLSALTDETW